MATAPDVCHLYTIVAVTFNIAIEEFARIEFHFFTISLDAVYTHHSIGISCSIPFNIKHINLPESTRSFCVKRYSICSHSGITGRNCSNSRVPSVRRITTTITGQFSRESILIQLRDVVDTKLSRTLRRVGTYHRKLHGRFRQREYLDIRLLVIHKIRNKISRSQNIHIKRESFVFLINGERTFAFNESAFRSDLRNNHFIRTIFFFRESHGSTTIVGTATYSPAISGKVRSPTPRVTNHRFTVGNRTPAIIHTIEICRTGEDKIGTITLQVDFPSLVEQIFDERNILSGRNRTNGKSLINRSRSTRIGSTAEVIAHSELAIRNIDRTGKITTFYPGTGNSALCTRTCGRHEDRVAVGTGELISGNAFHFRPLFGAKCKEFFKLDNGGHGNFPAKGFVGYVVDCFVDIG